ncbi:MAG TPA: hypothetical protein EYG82_07570 [Sulfurovum sp.]|nr:hypothetical protein [Sulfurovum sp.]
MAKIDEIKELIGFLKVLFAAFVAIDVSLVAWLHKSYETNNFAFNLIALLLVFIFSIGIVLTVKSILKNIKKLKDI